MIISRNRFCNKVSVLITTLLLIYGCIYDDPDCPTGVELRFTYTLNTQYRDLFDQQVNDLTLFLYDEQGKHILTKDISASALTDNNTFYLDLLPGNYRAIVWGNLDDNNFGWGSPDSFADFRLDLRYADGGQVTNQHDPLFHGTVNFQVKDLEKTQSTIGLIKDTNIIHVIMEDDLPTTRNVGKYAMISGCNGCYDIENNLVAKSTLLQYMAKYSPITNATRADFTVLRMFQDDDLELALGFDGADGLVHIRPLVAELMRHPEIKTNEDLDRWDEYTLNYKRDNFGTITLVKINDWEVIQTPGGI